MRSWLLPAMLLVVSGCETRVPVGTVGSSLALLDADRLVVVDSDVGSVSVLDADTLAPLARIDVGAEPRALLVTEAACYVVTRRGGELLELSLASPPQIVRRTSVCTGPTALAQTPAGTLVVACEWDGTVRAVDPTTLAVTVLASGLHAPVAVAAAAEAVFALESNGRLSRYAGGASQSVSLVPDSDHERPALTKMFAHDAAALTLIDEGHSVAVAFELVNSTDEGNGEAIVDSYGSVTDSAPKINPAVRAFSVEDLAARATPATYARYDADASLRCNGPSALVAAPTGELLVAHRSSADLTRLSLYAGSANDRIKHTWSVGAGPRGVAIDAAGKVAWVDNAFDGTVTRITLGDATAVPLTMLRGLPAAASVAALDGRRSFFDATNPHISPAGVVACGTCHPEGGTDDLAWFIRSDQIVAKIRIPPHLANSSADTAPYHWDGQYADRVSLVQGTIVNLMAGDGLLVDGSTIAAYLDELVLPPVAPPADITALARGEQVFASAGCATCHPAPLFTDRQKHAVLASEATSPTALALPDTPGLRGVFARTALLHDGRFVSLEDLLDDTSSPTHAPTLSAGDRADLLVYLRSL
jgi:DNA-binding beta-propeller fold protein YncE